MRLLTVFAGLLFVLAPAGGFADDAAWTGVTDPTWADVTNWDPNTVPGTGNIATFSGASSNTTIDLGGGVTVKEIDFDTASVVSYTIGSGGAGGADPYIG